MPPWSILTLAGVNSKVAPALPGFPVLVTPAVYSKPSVFVPSIDVDNPIMLPAFVGWLTSNVYDEPLTNCNPSLNGLRPVVPTQLSGA